MENPLIDDKVRAHVDHVEPQWFEISEVFKFRTRVDRCCCSCCYVRLGLNGP